MLQNSIPVVFLHNHLFEQRPNQLILQLINQLLPNQPLTQRMHQVRLNFPSFKRLQTVTLKCPENKKPFCLVVYFLHFFPFLSKMTVFFIWYKALIFAENEQNLKTKMKNFTFLVNFIYHLKLKTLKPVRKLFCIPGFSFVFLNFTSVREIKQWYSILWATPEPSQRPTMVTYYILKLIVFFFQNIIYISKLDGEKKMFFF